MAIQCYVETSHSSNDNEEHYTEGYLEALANCNASAVNMSENSISGVDVKRCCDCVSWVGRCLKGEVNKISRDEACNKFTRRLDGDKP